ncbi:MAG: hypothetical protein WCO68_09975 [Verrucomicrobiota bacterium]
MPTASSTDKSSVLLFAHEQSAAASQNHPVRVILRHGKPLLLLPVDRVLAAQALTLYPAQTFPARIAKQGLQLALRLGVPVPLPSVQLPVDATSPLTRFCSQWFAPERAAILLGNPAAPGRRFVILGFNEKNEPAVIVKAGFTDEARALIRKEARFLQAVASFPGIPVLRGILDEEPFAAFAMDFVPGKPPRDSAPLPELLGSWINERQMIPFAETQAGKALGGRTPAELQNISFHPVLHHGDLAPWNVRACPDGSWTVIDWERGDLCGIPGWDWFHFVIQQAVLVKKEPAAQVAQRVEQLFASAAFRHYTAQSGIAGVEKPLLAAYLLHCTEVIGQTEGAETLQALHGLFLDARDH